ncbi:1-phosphofructokinase [Olsenella sp. YH-ols2217]|uniref:1-phosphofructokinase n=1 Tax=Kribbibacterium absianum TaxID=3044210 RepID=A0ABT6ZK68_9ACTN|nr:MULTISPECIES: 1-phosphofructokinase [unclassified Olsenella]MDJ1122595.1 1-phosphofructokinase [Olsenella sp. YH-ols2216]MDJ1129445.1 1-phosphofructokinase [Olsenella sp. YH-ols2217]
MIYTVTLNPALDKTVYVDDFELDSVNRVRTHREDPGGKGINVSKVIRALGGDSRALALLGGATGAHIQEMLAEAGVDCWAFEVVGETRTNTKIVDEVRHTNTDVNEPGPTVGRQTLDDMLAVLSDTVEEGDVVVLSGSLPKGAPADTYRTWTLALKEAGAKVFVDADGEAFTLALEAAPSLVKPNEIELGAMLGRKLDTDEKVVEAARELVAQGIERVVVSRGGDGAALVDDGAVVLARSPKVKVGSTVGCGDSVVAALALANQRGLSPQDTMILATATGSANAMMTGTQPAPAQLVVELQPQVELA